MNILHVTSGSRVSLACLQNLLSLPLGDKIPGFNTPKTVASDG
jgi:hypothetical protein